jgi:hypothetical protein
MGWTGPVKKTVCISAPRVTVPVAAELVTDVQPRAAQGCAAHRALRRPHCVVRPLRSALCTHIASVAPRLLRRVARIPFPASRILHLAPSSKPTKTDSKPLPAFVDAGRRMAWRKLTRNRNVYFTSRPAPRVITAGPLPPSSPIRCQAPSNGRPSKASCWPQGRG